MDYEWVCVCCGWPKAVHFYGGGTDISPEDMDLSEQVLPGFTCSAEDCKGYTPSKEEIVALREDFDSLGPHEGQH